MSKLSSIDSRHVSQAPKPGQIANSWDKILEIRTVLENLGHTVTNYTEHICSGPLTNPVFSGLINSIFKLRSYPFLLSSEFWLTGKLSCILKISRRLTPAEGELSWQIILRVILLGKYGLSSPQTVSRATWPSPSPTDPQAAGPEVLKMDLICCDELCACTSDQNCS